MGTTRNTFSLNVPGHVPAEPLLNMWAGVFGPTMVGPNTLDQGRRGQGQAERG